MSDHDHLDLFDLAFRVLRVRPHPIVTEIQLVDAGLFYGSTDARDHVLTKMRTVRCSAANWSDLRLVLDHAGFWSWPCRWLGRDETYKGEWAVAIAWGGHAAISAGAIGTAPEVDVVLDEVERLVGRTPAQRAPQATSAYRPPSPQRHGETVLVEEIAKPIRFFVVGRADDISCVGVTLRKIGFECPS